MTAVHDFKGNHVFMWSSRALRCLPTVKKQKQWPFSRSVYNETMIRVGFWDVQSNRGLSKGYQPQPSADNLYLDLDSSAYHKNLIQ